MVHKLRLIAKAPRRYLPLTVRYALTLPLRLLSYLFSRAPFVLQEQMDIHPVSTWHDKRFTRETGGFFPPAEAGGVERRIRTPVPWDVVRRDMLVLLMRDVIVRAVPGAFAELGVYRGDSARLIHHYVPDRMLYLFDTFEGFDAGDIGDEKSRTGLVDVEGHFGDTSAAAVARRVGGVSDRLRFCVGRFPASFDAVPDTEGFAFVHIDVDLYGPVLAGLETFYPRLAPGGCIVVHDYNAWPGPRQAVEAFCAAEGLIPVPMPDKNGSAVLIKPVGKED